MERGRMALRRLGYCFLLSITAILMSSTSLYAFSIMIDQPKIDLTLSPGEIHSGRIRVENTSDKVVDVKIYLEDFKYTAPYDGSKEFSPAGSLERSCARWIVFNPKSLTLGPYEKKYIDYVLKVPADARGQYNAVLFFETSLGAVRENSNGANMLFLGRIGALFFVKTPDARQNARLEGLLFEGSSIKGVLNNAGDSLVSGVLSYYIIDKESNLITREKIGEYYLLPGDQAEFNAKIDLSEWRPGLTAFLSFDMGQGNTATAEIALPSSISSVNQ